MNEIIVIPGLYVRHVMFEPSCHEWKFICRIFPWINFLFEFVCLVDFRGCFFDHVRCSPFQVRRYFFEACHSLIRWCGHLRFHICVIHICVDASNCCGCCLLKGFCIISLCFECLFFRWYNAIICGSFCFQISRLDRFARCIITYSWFFNVAFKILIFFFKPSFSTIITKILCWVSLFSFPTESSTCALLVLSSIWFWPASISVSILQISVSLDHSLALDWFSPEMKHQSDSLQKQNFERDARHWVGNFTTCLEDISGIAGQLEKSHELMKVWHLVETWLFKIGLTFRVFLFNLYAISWWKIITINLTIIKSWISDTKLISPLLSNLVQHYPVFVVLLPILQVMLHSSVFVVLIFIRKLHGLCFQFVQLLLKSIINLWLLIAKSKMQCFPW